MPTQILSPLPGTFYRRPDPDSPPFKSVGDRVEAGEVVGLIEVMKTFNEVQAEAAGIITAFHADDEEPVMAGQPLLDME